MSKNAKNQKPRTKQIQKEDTSQGIRCWTENSRKETDQLYAQPNKKAQLPDMERIEEPGKELKEVPILEMSKMIDHAIDCWLMLISQQKPKNRLQKQQKARVGTACFRP